MRIPAIVGICSTRSWARVPEHRGQPFHAIVGMCFGQHQNLIVIGPTGVGKSWIACALAHKACRDDRSVLYHRVPRLFEALGLARSCWFSTTGGWPT
jgi:DNA replication protein DnaC